MESDDNGGGGYCDGNGGGSRKGEPLRFCIMNIWNHEIILLVSSTTFNITP